FGYTKSLDSASYTRASEDTLKEYAHIIQMKNTDKLCLFTAQGNMYQIKASAIPKGKTKDKGSLIQTLCKVDKEDILVYTCFEELFESQLLFTTKNGFIKQVSGAEFETIRAMITSTKLDADDSLVSITILTAHDILSQTMKVILLTEKGASLGFPLEEVSELKKTSRGVKAIALDANDYVVFATAQDLNAESFTYNTKELSAKKVRMRKRGQKGQKANLDL
ncbi:DNA gyrase C-terminal beta-propeller domain-containing protein, partial [Anaerosporobacter sp.]|uniref:DNA gyrase C-terminal beta-propeller domain-containing protein n=1 Tax=Anaerosporobacter sp. TaxID=1872529 RepID=UPI00286EDE0E